MRRVVVVLAFAFVLAGCVKEQAVQPEDKFPDDAPSRAFEANASGGVFAVHLDVAKEGRVAYRAIAREGAKVSACLLRGHDHELWWANHSVPVKACQAPTVIAKDGATLPAGAWSLVLRATGCPVERCNVTAVVVGARVGDAFSGPLDEARVESLLASRCAIC